jgi:hypothetical protein
LALSRKWLPNIRKLSQGKLDKTSGSGQAALFQKQTSKNKFKVRKILISYPKNSNGFPLTLHVRKKVNVSDSIQKMMKVS